MRAEVPQFRRCCFCIPLRRGLIGWGYVKLVLNIVTLIYLTVLCSVVGRHGYIRAKDIAIIAVVFTILLTDTALIIVFIVAGHQKSTKLLRVSHIHNIVALVLMTLAYCFKIYTNLYFMYQISEYLGFRFYYIFDLLLTAAIAFSSIFVQVYLILLIRSEMIKLQNQALEMQFSNHLAAGEPQCTLHNSSETDENTINTHIQDSCTDRNGAAKTCCCTDKKRAVQPCCTDKKQTGQDCCTD